jgi:hypothetical protein
LSGCGGSRRTRSQEASMRIVTLIAIGIVTAGAIIGSCHSARSQIWITCATEGQTCFVPWTWMTIWYGKNGAFRTRSGVSSIRCEDSIWGFDRDPLVGQPKSCLIFFNDASAVWKPCTVEGQVCTVNSNSLVRFGDENGNVWVYGSFGPSYVPCDRNLFGDPAFGVAKVCQFTN